LIENSTALNKKHSLDVGEYQTGEMVFPGMVLYIVGSNSPTPLKQKPCRNILRDEINDFPDLVRDAGDPMELSLERFKSFQDIRKVVDVSSPTIEEGNITRQEALCQVILQYFVPCPFCNRLQTYSWDQIKYNDKEALKKNDRIYTAKSTAHYECKFCKKEIDDSHREWMLDKSNGAGWFDMSIENPEPSEDSIADLFKLHEDRGVQLESIASRLSSIYSPWLKFGDIVQKYITAELSDVDPLGKQRAFVTDWLGEEFISRIEVTSESEILDHRCDLPPLVVHKDAIALTLGCDVHKRHIEYVIRAWARDYRSWLIRYGVIFSWDELYQIIFEDVYPVDGIDDHMKIWRAAIDTGGSEGGEEDKTSTEEVYDWLRNHGRGVVSGVKGSSGAMSTRVRQTLIDKMPGRKGHVIPGGLVLWLIDTAEFKETLHYRLQIEEEGPQYFYVHSETGKDYARQITAEEKRYDKRGKLVWHKTRANHFLDCELYAAACADPQWKGGVRVLRDRAKPRDRAPQPKSPAGGDWIARNAKPWMKGR